LFASIGFRQTISGSLKDCTGNQYPCLEPFQILNGKGQFHRFSGKYGIKEEEESEYKRCIKQDGSLVKLWRNCFLEIAKANFDATFEGVCNVNGSVSAAKSYVTEQPGTVEHNGNYWKVLNKTTIKVR